MARKIGAWNGLTDVASRFSVVRRAVSVQPYPRFSHIAALARRIDRAMVGLPLRFSLAAKWSLPTPGGIGVDPARRILFLAGDVTGYHLLFLRPHHILSAKVERKQSLHTVTHFSGSRGGVYGNGLTGGSFAGKARSTTTVNDEIFLEIQFRLAPHEAPRYLAAPCGAQRQWAESWGEVNDARVSRRCQLRGPAKFRGPRVD